MTDPVTMDLVHDEISMTLPEEVTEDAALKMLSQPWEFRANKIYHGDTLIGVTASPAMAYRIVVLHNDSIRFLNIAIELQKNSRR